MEDFLSCLGWNPHAIIADADFYSFLQVLCLDPKFGSIDFLLGTVLLITFLLGKDSVASIIDQVDEGAVEVRGHHPQSTDSVIIVCANHRVEATIDRSSTVIRQVHRLVK